MKIEIIGLELLGFHGVLPEEQVGQSFLYDITLEAGDRGISDQIEDAIDYREVAELVREVNTRRFNLIEALSSAVADAIYERFRPERVVVRVRKRPAAMPVEFTAATAERP
ncbi:MAG TPA: dihydroneopterin aldolase [Gaiellaceae bacterium]|jgi:dihydroneopterin aldolase